MLEKLDKITIFCFAASYGVALLFESLQLLFGVTRWRRVLALLFAAAGLLAHTVYVIYHVLPLQSGANTLLFLSWILAVFYLIGSLHHLRQAWGVFVLPVVLGLVLVARLAEGTSADAAPQPQLWPWLWLHVALLILGSVGLCVGFVASVMYLVQSWKLKHKTPPGEGVQLLSLERLETMNRRALTLAFPLLTGGLLVGVALLVGTEKLSWLDPKVLVTGLFWLVFALLLYLRYGLHLQGRRVAIGTILAFAVMLLAYVIQFVWPSSHPSGGGL